MKRTMMLAVLSLAITACSSKPEIKELPKSAKASDEITKLEVAIANSRQNDLAILAPESFSDAMDSLKEAKKMEKDDKDNEKVLKEVALGRAYLERAEKRAQKSRERFQDVLAARTSAINAKANVLLEKDFAKLDKKIKRESANLENDDENKIKEMRSDLIAGYTDLELAAIKEENLGESRRLIEGAVKNGASDLTPQSLAEANKSYQEADAYITQNRRDVEGIQQRSTVALSAAKKLDTTVGTARGLVAKSPEEAALQMQEDEETLNKTKDALSAEQDVNAALAVSNSQLSKDQELNAIYEKARTQFSPEEAEVYKQGKNLVIRLRGLEFPKSESVIRGENFALLKKVDTVIDSFGKSSVLIEGHTDSTGGKKINQKLSTERADAVRKYLEANASDKVENFESQGYGFDKPLASNKTPEGRAQNRRVDVIIKPESI